MTFERCSGSRETSVLEASRQAEEGVDVDVLSVCQFRVQQWPDDVPLVRDVEVIRHGGPRGKSTVRIRQGIVDHTPHERRR